MNLVKDDLEAALPCYEEKPQDCLRLLLGGKCHLNRPFRRYGGHIDFYCFERYYGILRGQINIYLPPEHPIIAI